MNYINEDTKIVLTLGQIKRLIKESSFLNDEMPLSELLQSLIIPDNETEDESIKSALALSLIASALSVGSILQASDVSSNIVKANTPDQVQSALNNSGKKTFGGYSAAQATNILMRTIYQEARGESELGRKMVATVIWNRAGGNVDKIPQVCLKKYQFSVWNGLTKKQPSAFEVKVPSSALKKGKNKDVWNEIKALVESMFNGTFVPEGNYNAYLNKDTASTSAVNGWGASMANQTVVGHHTFGYLKEYDGFKKGSISASPYATTYKVKKGDLGISYIAKKLINNNLTSYSNVKDLTDKIIEINTLKMDKRGNPIIRPGDVIKLPA